MSHVGQNERSPFRYLGWVAIVGIFLLTVFAEKRARHDLIGLEAEKARIEAAATRRRCGKDDVRDSIDWSKADLKITRMDGTPVPFGPFTPELKRACARNPNDDLAWKSVDNMSALIRSTETTSDAMTFASFLFGVPIVVTALVRGAERRSARRAYRRGSSADERGARIARTIAEGLFTAVEYIVPAHLAQEELGDAMEDIEDLFERRSATPSAILWKATSSVFRLVFHLAQDIRRRL